MTNEQNVISLPVRYMAPEVAMGGLYDESIDPFSLSLVAWEMLHLRKPYVGLNVEAHRRVVCVGGAREEFDRQVGVSLLFFPLLV